MNAQKPGLIKDAYIYGCDSIMLDLEDAVAENQKDAARFSLYHALTTIDYGKTEVIVRINGLDKMCIRDSHVGGFKDDGGFDAVAFKEPVLNGADAVSFRHADEAFADGVGDVDGFAVSVPMGEFCRARRHQNDLFVFNQHIIQTVGLLGRCNQPEVALSFGSQAFKRIAAVLDEVDFDKRITLDEFRNDEREELDAALAGNADAHASMHLFFGFRDFRTQVAVDIQHRLRRLNICLLYTSSWHI